MPHNWKGNIDSYDSYCWQRCSFEWYLVFSVACMLGIKVHISCILCRSCVYYSIVCLSHTENVPHTFALHTTGFLATHLFQVSSKIQVLALISRNQSKHYYNILTAELWCNTTDNKLRVNAHITQEIWQLKAYIITASKRLWKNNTWHLPSDSKH